MANDIVWYDSAEANSPQLTNAPGSLDAVLHACLVTGYNLKTLTSVSVTGGVATATLAGHEFSTGRVVEVAGATPSGLNGRHRITVTGSGAFTFPTTAANGVATGTITAKRAALGWSRPYSSGNVSMYARTDSAATSMLLRVDDSGAGLADPAWARVLMVESATGVSAYTDPSPTEAVYSGGLRWPKGVNTSTPKMWLLVGDGRTFYLFTDSIYQAQNFQGLPSGIAGFGDINSYRPGDPYACFLSGSNNSDASMNQGIARVQSLSSHANNSNFVTARSAGGAFKSNSAQTTGMRTSGRPGGGGPVYPSPVDNGIVLSAPMLVADYAPYLVHPIRGALRGIADPLANFESTTPAVAVHKTVLTGVLGSDRDWLMVGYQQQGSVGAVGFDITGPW